MGKNTKKVVIATSIIAVIVILIIVAVILFLLTDLFKSDQELFYKYLAKNGEMIAKYIEDPNKENIDSVKENQYSTTGTISFDLVSNDPEIANQTIPARNFSIEYSGQADPQTKKDSAQATLKFLNNSLFELKYAHNDDLYAITSSEVINKYLAFDNNNLKQLATKYGAIDVTNIPNKISLKDYSQLFAISESDASYVLETYMNVINAQVTKDKYYHNKDVMIQLEDTQIQANCYGVSINKEESKNLVIAILNQLKQDNQTLNLILSKIMLIDSETEITTETLKEKIANKITNLEASNELQGITIEIYESEGKLIKIVIETENKDAFTITYQANDNSIRTKFSYEYNYVNDINNKNTTVNNKNTTVNNENTTVDSENVINLNKIIEPIKSFKLKNIEIAKQTLEGQSNNVIIFTFEIGDDKIYKVSFQDKMLQNLETQEISKNQIINISDSDTTYFTIKINTTIKPSTDVKVEELTNENSATINNFTPEYTNTLLQAIVNRLQKLYEQKLLIISTVQQEENTQNNAQQNQTNNTAVQSNTIQ